MTLKRMATGTKTTLSQIEDCFGGRELLVDALTHAPREKTIDLVIARLSDPTLAGTSLAAVLADLDCHPSLFYTALKTGQLAKAQLLSFAALAQYLPAIVGDVIRRALPHALICQKCRGRGKIKVVYSTRRTEKTPEHRTVQEEPCPHCFGRGELQADPSKDAVEQALELCGLTGKQAGTLLIQQNVGVAMPAAPALGDLIEQTDKILYGSVIDGTTLPPAPPEVDDADASLF